MYNVPPDPSQNLSVRFLKWLGVALTTLVGGLIGSIVVHLGLTELNARCSMVSEAVAVVMVISGGVVLIVTLVRGLSALHLLTIDAPYMTIINSAFWGLSAWWLFWLWFLSMMSGPLC